MTAERWGAHDPGCWRLAENLGSTHLSAKWRSDIERSDREGSREAISPILETRQGVNTRRDPRRTSRLLRAETLG